MSIDVGRRESGLLGGLGFPGPSNVVPFWVCYGFWVRTLIRTTIKVLHSRV